MIEDIFTVQHYIFLAVAFLLSLVLVLKAGVQDKLEHLFLVFFLMTGNFNKALTFKIPGISFFEIQPLRFLFFMFSIYIFRKLVLSKKRYFEGLSPWKIPWFMVFVILNILFITASQVYHVQAITINEVIVNVVYLLSFLVIIFGLRIMLTKESIDLIGKTIVIGAVFTCIVSYIQFFGDPGFMRIGDFRGAFGSFLRANGLFKTEYFNAYYLITAIVWILATMRNHFLKFILLAIFVSGILLTFQRMSWLILAVVLLLYFWRFERPSFESLSFISMSGLSILIFVFMLFSSDIMNSAIVKERLADSVDGRKGYYSMVFDNIGKQPVLGYGSKNNEVYYRSMMEITRSRERATGEEGDIHSGYFQTLFFYGIPALLCFIGFILSTVYYFGKLSKHHLFFAIPFLFAILYLISNLTNTLLFDKYIATMFAIHIGLGWSARYMKEFMPSPLQV